MASSSLNKGLLDLFDCPICMNFMYPPIFQCPNGHHLCGGCKEKTNNVCPTCKMGVGDISSLILEKVGDAMTFPCKYQDMGCSGSFKYHLKQKHEKECGHTPYQCPFCTAFGDIQDLVKHLTKEHRVGVETSDKIGLHFSMFESVSRKVELYRCHSQYFFLQCKEVEEQNRLCVYVSFMGEQSEANEYRYRLEAGEEGDRNGKSTWQGIPRSIREQFQSSDRYGLTFPLDTIQSIWDVKGVQVEGCIWDVNFPSLSLSSLSRIRGFKEVKVERCI